MPGDVVSKGAQNITIDPQQVYEKKVTSLTNFNVDNKGAAAGPGARMNALSTPRLSQQSLHLPKVCAVIAGRA